MEASNQLRLPGLGYSLWLPGSRSVSRTLVSLPGNGFSLWGDGSRVLGPVRLAAECSHLPGLGFSVWTDAAYPQAFRSLMAAAPGGLRLPGEGHSLWEAHRLTPVFVRLRGPGGGQEVSSGSGLRLPAGGFSIWTDPDRARVIPSTTGVRLPGAAHTLWTQSFYPRPTAEDSSVFKETPLYPDSTHQPSLIARTMRLFGFAQWIGVFLILALLFGFLGSRQEAEELRNKLSDTGQELISTKRERQAYLDQVNDLEGQVEEAAAREAGLREDVSELEQAKTGIENTLNTQIANLEKAQEASETAKAEVEKRLGEVQQASEARQAELTQEIEQAQEALAKSQENVASLQSSVEELTQAKAQLETDLAARAQALEAAQQEVDGLKAQLDQSEKAKSELQKRVEELQQSLEAKEKEAEEAEQAVEEATTEARAAEEQTRRLEAMLGVEGEAMIAYLQELRRKVEEIQGDLEPAFSADL